MSIRCRICRLTFVVFGVLSLWFQPFATAREDPKPVPRVDTLGRPLPDGAIARLGGKGGQTHDYGVLDVAFCHNDNRIWTIDNTSLCRWQPRSFESDEVATLGRGLTHISATTNSLLARNRFDTNHIYIIDPNAGTTRMVSISDSDRRPMLSPDGQVLLCRSKNYKELIAWSLETGKQLSTYPSTLLSLPTFLPNSHCVMLNVAAGSIVWTTACGRTI